MVLLDRPFGIGNQSEVGVIVLGLCNELRPFLTGNRREGPILDGRGPVAETLDHRIDVEFSHDVTLYDTTDGSCGLECVFPLLFGPALTLQTLQIDVGVVHVFHGVGDQAVSGNIADGLVHLVCN